MKINDIEGKRVDVSARTITVKDEFDKTRGLVRNIESLYDTRPAKQLEVFTKLRQNGLDRITLMEQLDRLLLVDNEVYFLVDDFQLSQDTKFNENKLHNLIQKLEAGGITIIHCERVFWSKRRK